MWIHKALKISDARYGASRQDHMWKNHIQQQLKSEIENKELEKLKDSTQTLCIGSALIATVTFGATFAIPGRYRQDEHNFEGTPTLGRSYTFDAFLIANTLAFVCSSIATIGFMFSGTSTVDLNIRKIYFGISVAFGASSISSLTAAFALGVYVVLAPVAHKTAVAICMITVLIVVCRISNYCLKWFLLARPLWKRKGAVKAVVISARQILPYTYFEFWPFIVILCNWAASAWSHKHHRHGKV